MKFGIAFANTGPMATPEGAAEFAQLTEELGFESLWTVEHVVVPSGYESKYPYSPTGKMPGGEDSPIPDPLVWLTYVAAVTKKIRLGTGVLILPQRNTAVLAKECATIDVLSGGRLMLGVGVGWLKEEFDVIGVPFEERGARTDDHIRALRSFWTEDEPTYHGRFNDFTRAQSWPKPVDRSVPIHIGGSTAPAARRAGRLGDGYFPAGAAGLDDLLAIMRSSAVDAGRNPDAIEITVGAGPRYDDIAALVDKGVHRVTIGPGGADLEKMRRNLGTFSEQVIAKLG